jgi:uncharacterized membrane protein YoaT (DUF817 family)
MEFIVKQSVLFLKKQAYCALFGGVLLFFIGITYYVNPGDINRYDFLFIIAVCTQVLLLLFKYESLREFYVILTFHVLALIMEVYKVGIGSWTYFGGGNISLFGVPLFTGFMYSAIGSYMYRAWKINKFRFKNYPKPTHLITLLVFIYINFFTNHFLYDFRYILLVVSGIIFYKTRFFVELTDKRIQVHPLLANALTAFVIWISEQFGTFYRLWAYPNQIHTWTFVSFNKYISWYLLLIFSFSIISLFNYKKTYKKDLL